MRDDSASLFNPGLFLGNSHSLQPDVPKWQSMQSEHGKNPMNQVVEKDKLYKSGFESFKNGKNPLEVTDNLHTFNTRVLQAYIEDPSNKSISDMVGGSAEVLQEVVGSDAYARLKQVTSIARFKKEFNKRLNELEKIDSNKAGEIKSKIMPGKNRRWRSLDRKVS